jgi:hypothetical protein
MNIRQEIKKLEKFEKYQEILRRIEILRRDERNFQEEKDLTNKTIRELFALFKKNRDERYLKLIFDIFKARMAAAIYSRISSESDRCDTIQLIQIGISDMALAETAEELEVDQRAYINRIIHNVITNQIIAIKRRKREEEVAERGYPLEEGEKLVERYKSPRTKFFRSSKKGVEKGHTGHLPEEGVKSKIGKETDLPVDKMIEKGKALSSMPEESEDESESSRAKIWPIEFSPIIKMVFGGSLSGSPEDIVVSTQNTRILAEHYKFEVEKINNETIKQIFRLRDEEELSFRDIGEQLFPGMSSNDAEKLARNKYFSSKYSIVKSLKEANVIKELFFEK